MRRIRAPRLPRDRHQGCQLETMEPRMLMSALTRHADGARLLHVPVIEASRHSKLPVIRRMSVAANQLRVEALRQAVGNVVKPVVVPPYAAPSLPSPILPPVVETPAVPAPETPAPVVETPAPVTSAPESPAIPSNDASAPTEIPAESIPEVPAEPAVVDAPNPAPEAPAEAPPETPQTINVGGILDRDPPVRNDRFPEAPANEDILEPPILPGSSSVVEVTIGGDSGKNSRPTGINIGSMSSYAQGNAVNSLLAQGGGFELSNGRILVHTAAVGSTFNKVVIKSDWVWENLGMAAVAGQKLVGSTGLNKTGSWKILSMEKELDLLGNPTGNAVITIEGSFALPPVHADTFYVEILNYASSHLVDSSWTGGTAGIARDLTTARSGKASLGITLGSGQDNMANISFYMGADSNAGRNVLRQGHTYELSFWAKTNRPAEALISLSQGYNGGSTSVTLTPDGSWRRYSLTMYAYAGETYENGNASILIESKGGPAGKVNIDDIRLIDVNDQPWQGNTLSKEVIELVQEYGFADLRFWHPELRYARLDDMIGRPESRPMVLGPYSNYDPQMGLPEMLELARASGTAAWITLPTTWENQEIHNLMEYLGGSASTTYGAKRIADGHLGSWFDDLKGLYFEAGNESWNGTFYPASYYPFEPYFERAQEMFTAFKTDSLYAANASKLELVVNGWQWVPWFTEQAMLNVPAADAVDVSAYTGGPNTEMPIADLLAGAMSLQMYDNPRYYPPAIFGKKVYVYEAASGEIQGGLSAETEGDYATSLGGALAVMRNTMQLSRDFGIEVQNLFTMFQRGNMLPAGYTLGHYGIFTDLGTADALPRPTALGAKLLNQAEGDILSTTVAGGWMVDGDSTVGAAATTPAADAMVTFDGQNLVVTLFNTTVETLENAVFHFNLPALLDGQQYTPDWNSAHFDILQGYDVAADNEQYIQTWINAGQYTQLNREVFAALPGHSMGSLVIPVSF